MTETTQRLFVAVVPPADVLEHLDGLVAPLRVARPDLSWVSSRRHHITVAFMPHVHDDAAEAVPEAVAAAAAGQSPVRLSLAGSGRFDERVLWVGVAGDVDGLAAVSASVVAAAASVGASPERRPFRPHLSLARGAGRLDAHLGPLAQRVDAYAGPEWEVTELALVRSYLGRTARHETLAVLPLGG